jgi:hypothetical protein
MSDAMLTSWIPRNEMATLLPVSIVIGLLLLIAFRYASNQNAIRATKARLRASLYEMLLFADEPGLVWSAQLSLLKANARYIGLMLTPVLLLALPMVIVFANLEAFYGRAPLKAGEQAVVVAQLRESMDISKPAPLLQAPEGIEVETHAVRIPAMNQVSWRIRARSAVSGSLHIVFPENTVEKRIEAGDGVRYVSERRVNSWPGLLLHPGESRIGAAPVEWIEIRYFHKNILWLGFELHWAVWLLIISMFTALAFRRRLQIVF